MSERRPYDLTHFAITSGDIGRLQTLSVIPTVAGDSMGINLSGIFRLAPLRRQMITDCHVDLFAFYVPHRHIYGEKWIDFIKQGDAETVTFPTPYMSGGSSTNYGFRVGFATNRPVKSLPAWIPGGYMQIWDRYFRSPTHPLSYGNTLPAPGTAITVDMKTQSYNAFGRYLDVLRLRNLHIAARNTIEKGMMCCRLKTPWSTPVKSVPTPSDRSVNVNGNQFDILSMEKVKGKLRSAIQRDWFAIRYNDLLKREWGSSVDVDADQRPTLLMRRTQWLSGRDIDGTADANLGSYSGKAASAIDFQVPNRFYPEHGAIWIMALVRYPPLVYDETSPITEWMQPTYKQISADSNIWEKQGPSTLRYQDYFNTAVSSSPGGYSPYGQWYRWQPSFIHPAYEEVSGFPFIPPVVESTLQLGAPTNVYSAEGEYDSVFETLQLNHWQCQARLDVNAKRHVPGPLSSIFAGTT